MDIAFWIMRDMIVHDEVDIVHIESTRRDICSDKYTNLSFLIVLEGSHTIALLHISVDIGRRESISEEITLELLSLVFTSREYHDFIGREALEDTLEDWVFVSDTNSHEYVIDRIDCWSFREDKWLSFTLDMSIEKASDRWSIRRWECENLFEILESFPDLSHCRRKSHVHHLVDFIEDEGSDSIEVDPSTFDKIDETSWSSDDHLWSCLESFFLFPDRRSTIDSDRSHTHMTREVEYFISCLWCKFTSRLEDKNLWNTISRIDSIECWDTERCGLTRSCLRLDDQIFPGESCWDNLSLDFCRLVVTKIGKRLDDLWAKGKSRKTHRKKWVMSRKIEKKINIQLLYHSNISLEK
jgi:hypothetical protein